MHPPAGARPRHPSRRDRRPRRRTGLVVAVVAGLAFLSVYIIAIMTGRTDPQAATPDVSASSSPSPPVATTSPTPSPTPSPPAPQPEPTMSGGFLWSYATGTTNHGTAGTVRRYKVAVEASLLDTVPLAEFTTWVDSTLGDHRGWTGRGEWRLQRVPLSASSNFTIFLASPQTAYELCSRGYVNILVNGVPYASCRSGPLVVINSDRFRFGAKSFLDAGGSLADYRHMVINHEVGHALGWGHVGCAGTGQRAHVMQTQTLAMNGCRPNAWPYPDNPSPTGTDDPPGQP